MNKLFTKIGVAFAGIAMAVGVGVAVGRDSKVAKAKATPSEYTVTFCTPSGNNGKMDVKWKDASVTSATVGGITWSLSVEGDPSFVGANSYATIGTSSYPATKISMSTTGFGGYKITSASINARCSTTAGPTITITAGSTKMLDADAVKKQTSFYTHNTSVNNVTLANDGVLSFVFDSSVGAGITFETITVNYEAVTTEWSVEYNANCESFTGTVPTDDTTYSSSNNTVTVEGNTGNLSRGEKYSFVGWTTTQDGSGTVYGPGDGQTHTFTISSNQTFYAKWNQVKFTVEYDGNNNTSGSAPAAPTNYNSGTDVTVLGNTGSSANPAAPFVKTGYSFSCWNTESDGTGETYSAGSTISNISADIKLYAIWETANDELPDSKWKYTFTSKVYTADNQTNKLAGTDSTGEISSGQNWKASGTSICGNCDGTKGQQFGTSTNPATSLKFSSTAFSSVYKITSVVIGTSGASSVSASISVKVGTTDFVTSESAKSCAISASNTNYTFSGNASGAIEIKWTLNNSKALYVKYIEVNYEKEASAVATGITINGASSVDGEDATSVQSTFSYSVAYEAGKAGSDANVEISVTPSLFATYTTGGTEGNRTITVTFKKTAEFTITVTSTETLNVYQTKTVSVTNVTLTGYTKLTSETSLYAGAKILIVESSLGYAASSLTSTSGGYLNYEDVTIDDGYIANKGSAYEFILGGTVDNWTLTSSDGALGTKAAKSLATTGDDLTTTWAITINSSEALSNPGKANITSTDESLGRIQFNANSGYYRFLNYTSSPSASQLLPEIYIKAAENKIFNMIENTMRMGDTALKGNGSGACNSSNYYINAKKALATLSSTDRNKFRDNDGSNYTAALARYNAWAIACGDASPFDGGTTIASSQIVLGIFNNDNGNTATIIAVIAVVSTLAIGGFFFLRKRKIG